MSLQDQTTAYLRRLTYRTAAKSNDMTQRVEELKITPLFTPNVQHALAEKYPQSQGIYKQYALLAQRLSPIPDYDETERDTNDSGVDIDNGGDAGKIDTHGMSIPILLNINTPWSALICGSQGSGKSHTLSCILENCLLQDPEIMTSKQPLSAMVFNYDKHSSGRPCEAAFLASHVKTRFIVSPSNFWNMKAIYDRLSFGSYKPQTVPLLIEPKRLLSEQVKRLMAFSTESGDSSPLYMHASSRTYAV